MDLRFETCGNATAIVYDGGSPVLVTDPWVTGAEYFGSWRLPYEFSAEQLESVAKAPYVWLSHGHPDHLSLESLERFRQAVLLVPRHRGDRIASGLRAAGFKVQDLPAGEWLQLSPRVRILSYADWNQDAAALIALGERCGVLNLNDGEALGTAAHLRQQLAKFPVRFVLRLVNYGETDMMNHFTESGERVLPIAAFPKPLGYEYNNLLKTWRATHTAPFSCNHRFARTDSQWAAQYETPLGAHGDRFNPALGQLIPGYFTYDVIRDTITLSAPEPAQRSFQPPDAFGDDWSEPLEAGEREALLAYFRRFEYLRDKFQFITFRVGNHDTTLDLEGPRGHGITFEAPRTSLIRAVTHEIFDDLLIGNFMKTTLHGPVRSLYPDFTPYVAKYGDNGRAFSHSELRAYFTAYRKAAGLHGWIDQIRVQSTRKVRGILSANQRMYLLARRIYGVLKS